MGVVALQATAPAADEPGMSERGLRVLVIDDEPDVLLLCRVNLSHAGMEFLAASDGEAGIELARAGLPDVIVVDVTMPGMDGFAVVKELKRRPSTAAIPVIMLTAKARYPDQVHGWAAGIADYLTKPFSPDQLADAVTRAAGLSPEEQHQRRMQMLSRLSIVPQG